MVNIFFLWQMKEKYFLQLITEMFILSLLCFHFHTIFCALKFDIYYILYLFEELHNNEEILLQLFSQVKSRNKLLKS